MSTEQLEQRLSNLEQAVTRIAEKLDQLLPTTKKRTWEDAAGTFANDPLFDEIVEHGRAYRLALGTKDHIDDEDPA